MEASNSGESSKAVCSRWSSVVNNLELFFDLTVQLVKLYQSEGEREVRIGEVERLLSLRDEALKNPSALLNDSDKELFEKCKQLNEHLNGLMNNEKQTIQKDMKELKTKKVSTNKYVNPYENYSPDGIFYDRKK
jgi:flagellar protein FliT